MTGTSVNFDQSGPSARTLRASNPTNLMASSLSLCWYSTRIPTQARMSYRQLEVHVASETDTSFADRQQPFYSSSEFRYLG